MTIEQMKEEITQSINEYFEKMEQAIDRWDKRNRKIVRNTCIAGIGIGLALVSIGTYALFRATSYEPMARQIPAINPVERIYSTSGRPPIYIDEKPFGSLDKVIDFQNRERVERTPTDKDIEEFRKHEENAKRKGIF